jgi:hypothetical protein
MRKRPEVALRSGAKAGRQRESEREFKEGFELHGRQEHLRGLLQESRNDAERKRLQRALAIVRERLTPGKRRVAFQWMRPFLKAALELQIAARQDRGQLLTGAELLAHPRIVIVLDHARISDARARRVLMIFHLLPKRGRPRKRRSVKD